MFSVGLEMSQVILPIFQLIFQNGMGLQKPFGHIVEMQRNGSVPKISEFALDHYFYAMEPSSCFLF